MSDSTLSSAAAGEAAGDTGLELRDVLNRMLVDRIKEQETLAIAAASTDPEALLRYRELHARRLQLEIASRPAA